MDTIAAIASHKVDTSLFAKKDTLVIITDNYDTLKYNRHEFNNIISNFPGLYSSTPENPDISYHKSGIFKDIIDSNGNKEHITFGSESGQDQYYALYAYFLKKKDTGTKLEVRRNTLIKIYNGINDLFATLRYGGTYFGHQSSRIVGYAEYFVYWYSQREDVFVQSFDISQQKEFYLNLLKQIIADEESLSIDALDKKRKAERKKELFLKIDRLGKLITDNFYLRRAEEFQFSNY